MRVLYIEPDRVVELPTWPQALPARGFLWLGLAREDFAAQVPALQAWLGRATGTSLVDLHVADLLNPQLPSQFDYTSAYDLLVVRRLLARQGEDGSVLAGVDTAAVGFAVFDRLLLSVHPDDCTVRDHFVQRLHQMDDGGDSRSQSRLPLGAADLMLRMVNHIVDSYLELRRPLSRELAELQQALLSPQQRRQDWQVLLAARDALQVLEDSCEDQRAAVQEWIDALSEWPAPEAGAEQREREHLRVRSRDLLEHIERVLGHVRRLETSIETAVQIHFSAVGRRTNDIMRTLTVLTAIFLPLNLITGIFGMNFDALPLIHARQGFWVAAGLMACVGLGLGVFFWRKRYLGGGQGR
jgi:Mg2+ and Co2+ transporter CorA